MKLVVTVYEETCAAAVDAIREIRLPHDMVEVRAERFPSLDCEALRASTAKPMILTFRGMSRPDALPQWEGEGTFLDVEWHEGVVVTEPWRTVISHHDFEGMRDLGAIVDRMRALGCAYTKVAATPRTFSDNERLLALLGPSAEGRSPMSVIGMGERGLYTRVLAPFRGSELAFVAASNVAAPAQLTHERALQIYGERPQRAEHVFAVAGNPAGHSLSPVIHNRLFREKGVPAAYTIASFETFDEVRDALLDGRLSGLSVTTPFKEDAFRVEAELGENARRAKAVNTLVNLNGRIIADNTDVDGFAALIAKATEEHHRAAVLGSGPTARAALVALEDARVPATAYNRANLAELRNFEGDLIINALPPEAEVAIPRCRTYVEAAYSGVPRAVDADLRISGLELLQAQAVRQHELFMKVFDGL